MNTFLFRLIAVIQIVLGGVVQAYADQPAQRMPDNIEMVRAEDAPVVSIETIAKPADAPGAKAPLTLSFLDVRGDWLLTMHEGKGEFIGLERYHSRVAIYRRSEAGFRLEAEWFTGINVGLEKPRFFHMKLDGRIKRLLWVPGRVYGTGAGRQDAVFHLDRDVGMQPVAFEPAPAGYRRLHQAGVAEAVLLDGEGVWKGEHNVIHRPEMAYGDRISFTFYLWNEGDGNANPTAGRVDGTYKLLQGKKGLKIEIDTFKRVIFDKS